MTVGLVPLGGGTREVYGISLDPPGECGPVGVPMTDRADGSK